MKFASYSALPAVWRCNNCGANKPPAQMVMRTGGNGVVHLFHTCKPCRNRQVRERHSASRADYLRQWRARNRARNRAYALDFYWRHHDEARAMHTAFRARNHSALLIRARMKARGAPVSLAESRELLARFGPAYPTGAGLSAAGRRYAKALHERSGVSLREAQMIAYEDHRRYRLPAEEQPRVNAARAAVMRARWSAGIFRGGRRGNRI